MDETRSGVFKLVQSSLGVQVDPYERCLELALVEAQQGEIIDMKEVAGKNKNVMERLKGRVIGTGGKAREEIERLTDTYISVYGKTIGIIGEVGQAMLAREAMAMLLSGSMHKTVYQFLERKKKEILFG